MSDLELLSLSEVVMPQGNRERLRAAQIRAKRSRSELDDY